MLIVKLENIYRHDSIEPTGNSREMNFATHMCWSVIYFGLLRLTTTSSTIFFERNKNKCGIIGMNNWFLLSLCSTLPREWLSRLYTSLMNPMAPSILVWFLFYSGQTKGDLLIRSPHMTHEWSLISSVILTLYSEDTETHARLTVWTRFSRWLAGENYIKYIVVRFKLDDYIISR